jgi:hypothetical protein
LDKDDRNVGLQLVFLLKQRRDLYHQLKGLTDKQRELVDTASPELLLKILTGRRKLIEKLRQAEGKLGLIRSNWSKIASQVGLEHKKEARLMLEQAESIAGQIFTGNPMDSLGDLPVCEFSTQDELLIE